MPGAYRRDMGTSAASSAQAVAHPRRIRCSRRRPIQLDVLIVELSALFVVHRRNKGYGTVHDVVVIKPCIFGSALFRIDFGAAGGVVSGSGFLFRIENFLI